MDEKKSGLVLHVSATNDRLFQVCSVLLLFTKCRHHYCVHKIPPNLNRLFLVRLFLIHLLYSSSVSVKKCNFLQA
jgi:hypothetical protein